MKTTARYLDQARLPLVAAGVLALMAPAALASPPPSHQYPPGWETPENPPKPTYEFKGGLWNDTQRYWPDQQFPGTASSRSVAYGPIIYQFEPGSAHRHRVQPTPEPQQQ
jgi:hypothetical protein